MGFTDVMCWNVAKMYEKGFIEMIENNNKNNN
jgi:hypothetical protein